MYVVLQVLILSAFVYEIGVSVTFSRSQIEKVPRNAQKVVIKVEFICPELHVLPAIFCYKMEIELLAQTHFRQRISNIISGEKGFYYKFCCLKCSIILYRNNTMFFFVIVISVLIIFKTTTHTKSHVFEDIEHGTFFSSVKKKNF